MKNTFHSPSLLAHFSSKKIPQGGDSGYALTRRSMPILFEHEHEVAGKVSLSADSKKQWNHTLKFF